MKILLVGDPHVKKDNIEESDRIMEWVLEEAKKTDADAVMFLGDLYNDFASIRVEVLTFWRTWFPKFNGHNIPVLVIDGNHDMSTDCAYTANIAHSDQVRSTFKGVRLAGEGVFMLPFYRNNADFLEVVSTIKWPNPIIFCHQEFDGAMFENGFYAPHGIKLEDLPPSHLFISGHIHKKQSFGNIIYPGTSRYLTRSDAGEKKGIHLFDTQDRSWLFIPTPESVAEPFNSFKLKEGEDQDLSAIKDTNRTYVDLRGSQKYIKSMLKVLPKNIIIRTFVEEEGPEIEIKESDGIAESFSKYADKFSKENDLTSETSDLIKRMVLEKCPILKTQ